MFELFLTFFMPATAMMIPAMALAIFAIGGKTAGFTYAEMLRLLIPLGVLFGLWYGGVTVAAQSGLLATPLTTGTLPYILLFLLGGSLMFWGYVQIVPLARKAIYATDQALLTALQIPRMAGGIFLIGWSAGLLPWQFAFPAAIGDMIVGLLAVQATVAVVQNADNADRLIMRTNLLGILDFIIAVGTGVASSAGMLQLFAKGQTNIISQYPLVLIPAFLIPIFLGFHLFSLQNLRQSRHLASAASAQ